MRPRGVLATVWALAAFACAMSACSSGAPAGSPCMHAQDCASGLCLMTTGRCVARCMSTTECATGSVCGRFDYRGFDPDSGMLEGPTSDIVLVCRPKLNVTCADNASCTAPGTVCLAGPQGVCSTPCASDDQCPSLLCVTTGGACGAPGTCSPLCDDISECPHGWFCNLVGAGTVGHGRCEPMSGMTGGPGDAACSDAAM